MPLLLDHQVLTAAGSIFKRSARLMGNTFEMSVAGENEEWAQRQIGEAEDEIRRIERLLSTYSDESQTYRINEMAGIAPVKVDAEVFYLIERSLRISGITRGAFDISYGSVDTSLWNFDTGMKTLPAPAIAGKMARLINYRHIILNKDEGTVFLREKGMRIGFGGMDKGYAAERAKIIMQENSVESGIIRAAGNLTAWGNHPSGKPWTIGSAHPDGAARPFSRINISNAAVATAGHEEKSVLIGGKRYTSCINPQTGLPVEGIKHVTVICPQAEIAHAMATAVMVTGIEAGLKLLNQSRHITAILIDNKDKIFTTENIRLV